MFVKGELTGGRTAKNGLVVIYKGEFVATLNVAQTQNLKGFKAMVRLLEDIAEFLSKKGDELYQELKKLLDKLLAWIKKNKKMFRKRFKKIFFFIEWHIIEGINELFFS